MDFIWDSITDWLKEMLISGIVSNLSGMFDSTNEQVGNIVGQVGMTMPLMRISFSQSVMLSQIKSIEYPPID